MCAHHAPSVRIAFYNVFPTNGSCRHLDIWWPVNDVAFPCFFNKSLLSVRMLAGGCQGSSARRPDRSLLGGAYIYTRHSCGARQNLRWDFPKWLLLQLILLLVLLILESWHAFGTITTNLLALEYGKVDRYCVTLRCTIWCNNFVVNQFAINHYFGICSHF